MDIENILLKEYKDFIKKYIEYDIKILPKIPRSLSTFPTIIFKETGNSEYTNSTSLNKYEYVDNLLYTVEIYSKDIVINNECINSKQIINQLKQLTFDFFRNRGFVRLSCDIGEYNDFTVDRIIITEQGKLNNWNRKII